MNFKKLNLTIDQGTVYILYNKAMPGLIKVGKTKLSVEDREKNLAHVKNKCQ